MFLKLSLMFSPVQCLCGVLSPKITGWDKLKGSLTYHPKDVHGCMCAVNVSYFKLNVYFYQLNDKFCWGGEEMCLHSVSTKNTFSNKTCNF